MKLNKLTVNITRKGILPLIIKRNFNLSTLNLENKLNQFLNSLPSVSENPHLYTTTNIKDCSQVLLKMYNSLSDPVLKLYVQNNCLHLIYLEKYINNISQKKFLAYKVDGQVKQGHPSLYKGMSGCYVFFCLKTGDFYVGSAVCLNTRYKSHKVNSSRPERGGFNSLYLSVRKHGWHNFI